MIHYNIDREYSISHRGKLGCRQDTQMARCRIDERVKKSKKWESVWLEGSSCSHLIQLQIPGIPISSEGLDQGDLGRVWL